MAKAKKKAKKAKAPCGLTDMVIVGSKVRAYIKSKGVMMSGELLGALNCKVGCLIDAAVARTVANGRKTVKPQDL